jgi:hypothetical protein
VPKPIKKSYSHNDIVAKLAEKAGRILGDEVKERACKEVVKMVLDSYAKLVQGTLVKGGAGEIKLFRNLVKLTLVKVPKKKRPAIKKGTLVRNPFTGKEEPHKGRKESTIPATVKIKARALSALVKVAKASAE